jgi:hypothetical protein
MICAGCGMAEAMPFQSKAFFTLLSLGSFVILSLGSTVLLSLGSIVLLSLGSIVLLSLGTLRAFEPWNLRAFESWNHCRESGEIICKVWINLICNGMKQIRQLPFRQALDTS